MTFRPLVSSAGGLSKLFDRTCTSDVNGGFTVAPGGAVDDFVAMGLVCKVPVFVNDDLYDSVASIFDTVADILDSFGSAAGL